MEKNKKIKKKTTSLLEELNLYSLPAAATNVISSERSTSRLLDTAGVIVGAEKQLADTAPPKKYNKKQQ